MLLQRRGVKLDETEFAPTEVTGIVGPYALPRDLIGIFDRIKVDSRSPVRVTGVRRDCPQTVDLIAIFGQLVSAFVLKIIRLRLIKESHCLALSLLDAS